MRCAHLTSKPWHTPLTKVKQESRADAGVSAQQSRHLAINYELEFSSAIEALTCAATWRKR